MPWLALVGPEIEENLSLRYLASSLERAGFGSEIIGFNREEDLPAALDAILVPAGQPLAVALSLAFQWRALDFLALALALRERGYSGHVTAAVTRTSDRLTPWSSRRGRSRSGAGAACRSSRGSRAGRTRRARGRRSPGWCRSSRRSPPASGASG